MLPSSVFKFEHSRTAIRGGSGWPWPWSEPTRCEAGTRSERFIASPSIPVILQADRSTVGPRAPDHCRYWKLLGDAAAEVYERRARSRRAERAMASQACCRLHASARMDHFAHRSMRIEIDRPLHVLMSTLSPSVSRITAPSSAVENIVVPIAR
jgi:hypothetical protein